MKNNSLTFALFNFFFAAFYAAVQLEFLKTASKAQIYKSVRESYLGTPIPGPNNSEGEGVKLQTLGSSSELLTWLSTVFVDVTYREQEATIQTANRSSSPWNTSRPSATIHSFNRVLVFRFSIKRWALRENKRGKFSQEYPVIVQKNGPELDPGSVNVNENRSKICGGAEGPNGTTLCVDWQGDGGYGDAGGYVFYFDPQAGRAAFEEQLKFLSIFFDRWLGSFTIDMMAYNGNVKAFTYMPFLMTFDMAGNWHVKLQAKGFDFSRFYGNEDTQWCAIYVVLSALLLWLLISELRSMLALTMSVYFRRATSWMIISSILLCSASIVSYWVLRDEAQAMDIEFADLTNPDSRESTFIAWVQYAELMVVHQNLAAFSLLTSFLRAVFLIGGLQSNLGLILKVLEVTAQNLFTFFIMFLEIMLGFVFFGFFVFGTKLAKFQSIEEGLYTCFAMFTGKSSLRELQSADPAMAPLFYYAFYISFYFIFKNLFISILMSGYDIVDYEIKSKAKERSPAQLVYHDLKSEVYDPAMKYGSMIASFGRWTMRACKDSLMECLGICGLRLSGRERTSVSYGDDGDRKSQAGEDRKDHADSDKGAAPEAQFELVAFVRIVVFMLTVLVFVFLSRYGKASYELKRVALGEILDDSSFKEITSFEEVQPWARYTLSRLYASVRCADYSSYPSEVKNQEECDSSAGSRQWVQQIKANTGFLKTTFARLTVQPACFVQNPDALLLKGFPIVRITPNLECASTKDCQLHLVKNGRACYTPDGLSLDSDHIFTLNVPGTSLTYNYSLPETGLGAAALHGGFVFNFGSKNDTWQAALDLVERGDFFTWKSTSMVFDWLMYNGNKDLFTHSKVEFSLMNTGKMVAKASAITFTLDEFAGGGPSRPQRITLLLFLILYVIQVLVYVIELIASLVRPLVQGKQSCREISYRFLTDIWRLVDTLSLTISIAVMVSYFHLLGMTFRQFTTGFRFADYTPQIPQDLVRPNAAAEQVEDWYVFQAFEDFGGSVEMFRTLAALNSFFISFKVIKFVNTLESVQVFSSTLATGAERMLYFFIILAMMLVGAAMFTTTFFGHAVESVERPMEALRELFLWILGEFDLNPFIEINKTVAITYFIMYMMVFQFIYMNIFLATMLNTYSEKVGERDIASAHKEMILKSGVITVDYDSKEDMDKDIELCKDKEGADGTRIVVKALKGEKAKNLGVDENYVLVKINHEKQIDSERVKSMDGPPFNIQEDASTTRIMLRFQPPQRQKVFSLRRMWRMGHKEELDKIFNVPPTVKNFWRREGATVWIRQQAARKASQPSEMQARRAASDPAGATDVDSADAGILAEDRQKDIKNETKETLERLLFSRWMDGARDGRDGSGGKGMAWEATLPLRNKEDANSLKNDWSKVDIEDLRMEMKTLRVSGHEMWLDVLVAAIEREMEEGSVVTSVLGTSEMYDKNAKHAKEPKTEQQIRVFYERATKIFQLLEYTAFKEYYRHLHLESEEYQEHLRSQNRVLNDYVCELEKKFTQIMQEIHKDREKKDAMLTTLAGLMDRSRHRPQGTRSAPHDQDEDDR